MTTWDSGSDSMVISTAKTFRIYSAVRSFFSGKKGGDCAILQSPDGNRQKEADNQTQTWHREQNLPVVVLISTDLFKRVVSAL